MTTMEETSNGVLSSGYPYIVLSILSRCSLFLVGAEDDLRSTTLYPLSALQFELAFLSVHM